MAPAASQLVVGGDSCNEGDFGQQGLVDADLAILDGTGARRWPGGVQLLGDRRRVAGRRR